MAGFEGSAREPIFTPASLSAIPATQKKITRPGDRQCTLRRMQLAIRCGTPDCEWGFPMPNLGEVAVEACYFSFRKHCVEVHGLKDDDLTDSGVFLDLREWLALEWRGRMEHLSPSICMS